MKRSLHAVLTDKRGLGEIIGAVVGLVAMTAAVILSIAGIKLVNEYTTLNEFGDQLVRVVSDYGQCGGSAYNDTYQKLVDATTLSPTVNFTADYFNASRKTVQYGETIELVLTWDAQLGGIPVPMTITKIGRSEQYWK